MKTTDIATAVNTSSGKGGASALTRRTSAPGARSRARSHISSLWSMQVRQLHTPRHREATSRRHIRSPAAGRRVPGAARRGSPAERSCGRRRHRRPSRARSAAGRRATRSVNQSSNRSSGNPRCFQAMRSASPSPSARKACQNRGAGAHDAPIGPGRMLLPPVTEPIALDRFETRRSAGA